MSPVPSLVSSFLQANRVIVPRQATTTVVMTNQPTTDVCSGQYTGGTLAGAIVGTFFGTLLLVWFFWSLQQNRRRIGAEEIIVERKVRSNGSRRHHSRSGSHSSVRRPSRVYSTRS